VITSPQVSVLVRTKYRTLRENLMSNLYGFLWMFGSLVCYKYRTLRRI
jgi:hypothetical protein